MNFHQAKFLASYGLGSPLPRSRTPEIVFAGRSNVGKSSLINTLCYRKNLAHTSSSPGKTATINFYDVDGVTLIDLPGYGYAKVSKAERDRWARLTDGYWQDDRRIALAVALIDIRHDLSVLDRQLVEYLGALEVPLAIVLTKADKLSRAKALRQQLMLSKELNIDKNAIIVCSAQNSLGCDELRRKIVNAINSD